MVVKPSTFSDTKMPISLSSIVQTLPSDETWGPATTTDALVDGVPYAPYSKGDKLGRMADWTTEGKDKDGRGGRQQYNRVYRGEKTNIECCNKTNQRKTNRYMVPVHLPSSLYKWRKMNPPFPSSIIHEHQPRPGASVEVALPFSEAEVEADETSVEDERITRTHE